jgi:hypothetical protein
MAPARKWWRTRDAGGEERACERSILKREVEQRFFTVAAIP